MLRPTPESKLKLIKIFLFFLLLTSSLSYASCPAVCNCIGYDGYGGPCYDGFGGPCYGGFGGGNNCPNICSQCKK